MSLWDLDHFFYRNKVNIFSEILRMTFDLLIDSPLRALRDHSEIIQRTWSTSLKTQFFVMKLQKMVKTKITAMLVLPIKEKEWKKRQETVGWWFICSVGKTCLVQLRIKLLSSSWWLWCQWCKWWWWWWHRNHNCMHTCPLAFLS